MRLGDHRPVERRRSKRPPRRWFEPAQAYATSLEAASEVKELKALGLLFDDVATKLARLIPADLLALAAPYLASGA